MDPKKAGEEWKALVQQFDKELRAKRLTDAQREQLLKEILEGDKDDKEG